MRGLKLLRNDAGFTHDRNKIRITYPAGKNMQVKVMFNPGAGRATEIESNVESIWMVFSAQTNSVTVIPLIGPTISGISGNSLNYSGGSGSQFVLLTSNDVATPLASWGLDAISNCAVATASWSRRKTPCAAVSWRESRAG